AGTWDSARSKRAATSPRNSWELIMKVCRSGMAGARASASIEVYAKDFEHPIEFIVGSKSDLQGALSPFVTQGHPGPESFAQLILEPGDMRIAHRAGGDRRPCFGRVGGGR